MAVDGIEECRRSCGGHGYSMFSGLGHFYNDYLPTMTVSDFFLKEKGTTDKGIADYSND